MRILLILFLAAIPFRCAQAADGPTCSPLPGINSYTAKTTDGRNVGLVWCDDQDGLNRWFIAGTLAETLDCLNKATLYDGSLPWVRDTYNKCINRPMTDTETAAANALQLKWMPRLKVQAGANRNIYLVKADGTKGAQWVNAGVGMQVAPGKFCKWGPRLKNAGARYARVEWLLSTNNFTIPTGGYALCSISFPPATGWPPL